MLPQWSPQALANIIFTQQIRSRVHGEGETFVMVEGKTDHVFWEEYRSREDCIIYPVNGKDRVVDTLGITNKRGSRGVAGVVDADYWLISEADELGTENLLYDDCCPDMESILLSSPALKKHLRNELYNYDIEEVHELADKLKREGLRLSLAFGYFRLLNHLNCYGLKFNAIPMSEVIDLETLELDAKQVASRLTGYRSGITSDDLLQQVEDLRERYPPDNLQLSRGKDVVSIIAHILPTLFRSQFGADLPPHSERAFGEKALAISLRSAYEFGYFKQTSLFGCIRTWESANCPYKILKPEN
jgi:hypothetical protein